MRIIWNGMNDEICDGCGRWVIRCKCGEVCKMSYYEAENQQ